MLQQSYLSTDDLTTVRSLEMKADSSQVTLSLLGKSQAATVKKAKSCCVANRANCVVNTGERLPNLTQLKLNNSLLGSLRDLGTSLANLQVLAPDDGVSSCLSQAEVAAGPVGVAVRST